MGQSIQNSPYLCCASSREMSGPLKTIRPSVEDVKLRAEGENIRSCGKCRMDTDQLKIFENHPCKHPICIDCLGFKPANDESYCCPITGCTNKINIIELNKFWYDAIKEEYGDYDPFTFLTVAKTSKDTREINQTKEIQNTKDAKDKKDKPRNRFKPQITKLPIS